MSVKKKKRNLRITRTALDTSQSNAAREYELTRQRISQIMVSTISILRKKYRRIPVNTVLSYENMIENKDEVLAAIASELSSL